MDDDGETAGSQHGFRRAGGRVGRDLREVRPLTPNDAKRRRPHPTGLDARARQGRGEGRFAGRSRIRNPQQKAGCVTVHLDVEGNEIAALREYAGDLSGRRVLEVGSGNWRLTWRYAGLAGQVTALDPNEEKIALARRDMPDDLRGRVELVAAGIEEFQPEPPGLYDVAIMAWSL